MSVEKIGDSKVGWGGDGSWVGEGFGMGETGLKDLSSLGFTFRGTSRFSFDFSFKRGKRRFAMSIRLHI